MCGVTGLIGLKRHTSRRCVIFIARAEVSNLRRVSKVTDVETGANCGGISDSAGDETGRLSHRGDACC